MANRDLVFVERTPEVYATAVLAAMTDGTRAVRLYPDNLDARELADVLRRALPAGVKVTVVAESPAKRRPSKGRPGGPDVIALLPQADEELPQLLHDFLDWEGGCLIAPRTRNSSAAKPLFLVSIPKAGTHMLYELARQLGYQDGVELTSFAKPAHWYCLEYSNSHTTAPDFFVDSVRRAPFGNRAHPFPNTPTLFLYRNPLDILVSEANYYHRDGNAVFSGYLPQESFDARIDSLIDDSWMLGSIRERVGRFLPWTAFPNVIPVSYEELVGTRGGGDDAIRARLIWSLQLKLQASGVPERIAEGLFDKESPTFHKGTIGGYRDNLSVDALARIARFDQDFIEQLGYAGYDKDSFPFPPRRSEEFRRRPLALSQVDHDLTPIAVEDCLGCNLVRYMQRYYAVPQHLGALDLGTLSETQRAGFISAEALGELKNRLILGPREYDHAWLRAAQHKTPQVLEDSYSGYNLISFAGRVWAAERAAGPVDFSNPAVLASWQADGRLLPSGSIDGARMAVDRVLDRRQAAASLSGLASSITAQVTQATSRLEARQDDVAERLETDLQASVTRSEEAINELGARVQQDQQALASSMQAQVAEAASRLEARQDDVAERLETDLQASATRSEEAINELGARVQQDQQALASSIQAQVTEATLRLEARQDDVAERLETDLQASVTRSEEAINELGARVQQDQQALASSMQAQVAEAASRLEARQDDVAERLEADLQTSVTRNAEAINELGARLQNDQQALAGRLSRIAPESEGPPRILQEDYRGFNLIAGAGGVWGVRCSAGPIDFSDHEERQVWLEDGWLVRADTLDGVRTAVDQVGLAERIAGVASEADGLSHGLSELKHEIAEEFRFSKRRSWYEALAHSEGATTAEAGPVQTDAVTAQLAGASMDFVEHEVGAYVAAAQERLAALPATGAVANNVLIVGSDPVLLAGIADNLRRDIVKTIVMSHEFTSATCSQHCVIVLAESDEELLSSLLLQFSDQPGTLIAPITSRHISRQGAYVVTIPKSGSHLLYELLDVMGVHHDTNGYLQDSDPPLPGTWKSAKYPHTHLWAPQFLSTLAAEFEGGGGHPFFRRPVVFLYRNPCDILVSESYYYADSTKTALAAYFRTMSKEEKLCSLIDWDPLIGSLGHRMGGYLPWFQFGNVIPVSYEELVGEKGGGSLIEQLQMIWALQLKLRIPGSAGDIATKLRDRGGNTATFRRGKLGGHKSELTEFHWKLLAKEQAEYMPQMGYAASRDAGDPFPAHRVAFRRRPLELARGPGQLEGGREGSEVAANMVEEDYCGYNLVASLGRFWAIDLDAGEVDFGDRARLEEMTATGQLLASDTADGVRMEVLSRHFAKVHAAFEKRLSLVAPAADGETTLLEEDYRGYNLLAGDGKVWALEASAGEVDFADTGAIEALRAKRRLLVADSLDGVRVEILSVELARNDARRELQISEANSSMALELRESDALLARRLATIAPDSGFDSVVLEQDYRGYNLVAYAGRVWALEMTAGEIDLAATEVVAAWHADGRLDVAATVDGARGQVDRLLDRREQQRNITDLGEIFRQQFIEIESRLGARMDATDHRIDRLQSDLDERLAAWSTSMEKRLEALAQKSDDRMDEVARRLEHSQQLEEQRLERRLAELERPWWQRLIRSKSKNTAGP